MSHAAMRPAVFVKLESLRPGTRGHNVVVKVLEKRRVFDRVDASGVKLALEECLVADETGCMLLTARNDQCQELEIGSTVNLRNCKVTMYRGYMRIAVDKWGSIKPQAEEFALEPNLERNFSDTEYKVLPKTDISK